MPWSYWKNHRNDRGMFAYGERFKIQIALYWNAGCWVLESHRMRPGFRVIQRGPRWWNNCCNFVASRDFLTLVIRWWLVISRTGIDFLWFSCRGACLGDCWNSINMTSSRKSLLMGFFCRTPMVTWLLLLSWAGKRRCSQFVGNWIAWKIQVWKVMEFLRKGKPSNSRKSGGTLLFTASEERWAKHLAY